MNTNAILKDEAEFLAELQWVKISKPPQEFEFAHYQNGEYDYVTVMHLPDGSHSFLISNDFQIKKERFKQYICTNDFGEFTAALSRLLDLPYEEYCALFL